MASIVDYKVKYYKRYKIFLFILHKFIKYQIVKNIVSRNSRGVWFKQNHHSKFRGCFGNVVLLTLFKNCRNTCEWKNVVEIRVVLFKQWKLLFKQRYQTDPISITQFSKFVNPTTIQFIWFCSHNSIFITQNSKN